jgi:hypothetical protein
VQTAPPLEAELDAELAELDAELAELDAELAELDAELAELELAEVLLDAAVDEDVPPLPVAVLVLPVTVLPEAEALPIAPPVPLVPLVEDALPPAPGPPTTWPQLAPRGASATIHPTAERIRARSMDTGDPPAGALATGRFSRGPRPPPPPTAR